LVDLDKSILPLRAGGGFHVITLVKSAVISALAGFCLVSSAQDHELTTDVVVIGGGISGLSSAMSVLDHGGKVVVLEKLPGLGDRKSVV